MSENLTLPKFCKRCNRLSVNSMTRLNLIIYFRYRLTSMLRHSQEVGEKHIKMLK